MLSNSRVAYREHNHLRCQNAAMQRARSLCEQHKVRLTPIRENVLRLLWQSHRPLGAYEIIEQLSDAGEKSVKPPTVYRAIDFLLEQGLAHRLATLNAYIGCPFPGNPHRFAVFVCQACGSAAESSFEAIDNAIGAAAARADFEVHGQAVEVTGLCPQCRCKADD